MTRLVAVLAAVALATTACGTPGSLPEPPPCDPPDPALAPGAEVDRIRYATAVYRVLDDFQVVDQAFRLAWPDRRFRERDSFKQDFIAFAGGTRCLIDEVQGANVPNEAAAAATDLLAFLVSIGASLDAATDAVDTRNASAYRDWIRDFDSLVVGYTDWQERMRALGGP